MRLLLSVFLLNICLSATARAELELAGQVIFFKGGAVASQSTSSRNLQNDASVYQGDTIQTGNGARLALEMTDGAIITLGGATRFKIHDYQFKPQQGLGSALLELITGAFRAITGEIGKLPQRNFKVQTQVATIGIRGTDFWGGFSFGDALDVALIGGEGITIENSAGRVEILTVGQGTTVRSADLAPSKPKNWPAEKVRKAQKITSWGS